MSESINARLKGRGIGNGGMNVPRWVSTDKEMRWLCYGTSFAFTLQRLAHHTGIYEQTLQHADAEGLLTPCQPDRIATPASAAPAAPTALAC